ncbi:MAG: DUF2809 domain-containing protein [Thiotrichaceae bacterium]|nr:DUF2809 domain-containing protein [Thiotrichaceae bacterium]
MHSNTLASSYKRFPYIAATIVLFAIEVFIAIAIPADSFIRHSFGDYLVVILVYCSVKSVFNIEPMRLAIAVCIFAFLIEFSQYIHVLDHLNINNNIIRIVLGTSFSFGDLVMYTLGSLSAYFLDYGWIKLNTSESSHNDPH